MKALVIIPARGGSKGIPKKNIKVLNGKPLIHYSIELARQVVKEEDICLTTDSQEIIDCAKLLDYQAPFVRPLELAADTSGTYEVLVHAYQFYLEKGIRYEAIILLQPTSPFRLKSHLEEALLLYSPNIDMVVSVKESADNPYYNLFEETNQGTLKISKGDGSYTRRQDVPPVYAYNGSIYIINPESLLTKKSFREFERVVKYRMGEAYSIDLDTPDDWEFAEYRSKKME